MGQRSKAGGDPAKTRRSKASKAVRRRSSSVAGRKEVTEARRLKRSLLEIEERYALAMQAVNEGVYDWNIATGEIYYSPRVRDVVELTPEQLGNLLTG